MSFLEITPIYFSAGNYVLIKFNVICSSEQLTVIWQHMIPQHEIERENQQTPGDRLNRILDQAQFQKFRGRSVELFDFLNKHCPEDWDLKASTVRSWFSKSAPPMKKIILIIEILDKHYGFKGNPDLKAIQGWWKVGGADPFIKEEPSYQKKPDDENVKKLEFLLPSIILEQVGDDFSKLSSVDLDAIKDFTTDFLVAFSDESIKNCPDEYIKMAINHIHQKIVKQG